MVARKIKQQYPNIWGEISLLLIAFPSSYVVEKAFSSVINVLNKRSNLDISKGGDLRLYLTELKPNTEMLARDYLVGMMVQEEVAVLINK